MPRYTNHNDLTRKDVVNYARARLATKRRKRSRAKPAYAKVNQWTVQHYVRTVKPASQIFELHGTGAPVGNSLTFQLSDIPTYTDYTALFDEYRINRVEMDFRPIGITMFNQQATSTSGGPITTPFVHTVIDYDDDTAPTTVDTLLQYSNVRKLDPRKPFKYTIYPRVQQAVYLSGVATGYGTAKKGIWLDASNPSIPHYGLKWFVDAFTMTNVYIGWEYEITYYVSFRGQR